MNRLKKKLDDAKGRWVEELPYVLWTYRTIPQRSTRETRFSMTYRAKTFIPMLRTSSFNLSSDNEFLEKSLDFIEERRESTMV